VERVASCGAAGKPSRALRPRNVRARPALEHGEAAPDSFSRFRADGERSTPATLTANSGAGAPVRTAAGEVELVDALLSHDEYAVL